MSIFKYYLIFIENVLLTWINDNLLPFSKFHIVALLPLPSESKVFSSSDDFSPNISVSFFSYSSKLLLFKRIDIS